MKHLDHPLARRAVITGAGLGFVEAATLRHLPELLMGLHELLGQRLDIGPLFRQNVLHLCLLRIGEVKIRRKEPEHMAAKGEAHADPGLRNPLDGLGHSDRGRQDCDQRRHNPLHSI